METVTPKRWIPQKVGGGARVKSHINWWFGCSFHWSQDTIHGSVFPQELLQWFLISRGFWTHRYTNAGSAVFLLKNLITTWCRQELTVHKWGNHCLAMHSGSHLAMLMTWPRLIKERSGTPMQVTRSKLSHPPRPHGIRYIHGLIFPSTYKFRFIRNFHIHGANN